MVHLKRVLINLFNKFIFSFVMHQDQPRTFPVNKLRIRNNRSMDIDVTEHKRNRSMSFNGQTTVVNQRPSDYLKQVQKIIDGARDTSKIVNLEFRKYSSKPEMQMVYIDSDKMQKKLQQMGTRLDSNKYQMIVEVKKDPIMDALAMKKQVVKDEIQRKNYKSIYKQYIKDYNGETFELVKDPLIALYQFYDEEQKDWKDQLKNKCLISRQVRRETIERMLQSRSKTARQARLAREKQLELHWQNKLQLQQAEKKDDYDQLRASHRSTKSQRSDGRSRWFKNTKYDQIFEEVAEENNLYQHTPNAPNPEKIILNRFQQKFYRCRQKKYQHLFDRAMTDESQQQQQQNHNTIAQPCSQLKKTKKLVVPETCKRIYKTQNRLLEQGITNGLSRDNAKKLIVEFNKTIVEMKAKQNTTARTNNTDNEHIKKYKIRVHK